MIPPILIPILIPIGHSETPKCPKCKRNEDIKEVCRHCGYEYKHEPTNWYEKIIIAIVTILILWAIITVSLWLMGNLIGDNKTLWEQIKLEWEWLQSLRLL